MSHNFRSVRVSFLPIVSSCSRLIHGLIILYVDVMAKMVRKIVATSNVTTPFLNIDIGWLRNYF